ncbi:MAG: extracellular solute-binding protein [Clostridiales bacterium]|nr:extracellular solute-binding protein [Clostridiales bacterium]
MGEVNMKSKTKTAIVLLVILALIVVYFVIPRGDVDNYATKYADAENLDTNENEVVNIGTYTYKDYLNDHAGSAYPGNDVSVNITDYTVGEGVEVFPEYEGEKDVLFTDQDSYVEWQVDVPEAGLYQIYMEYYTVESRGVDIEKALTINGKTPFSGADALTFTRHWTDDGDPIIDNQGNEIRPTQIDVPVWTSAYFKDDLGYFVEPYTFYFEKGQNTIGLKAVNEPTAIKSLTLIAIKEKPSYSQYRQGLPTVSASAEATTYKQVIQGEHSTFRSSPSLYPLYDRSSPSTVPNDVYHTVLNMIGGNSWRVPGQWIEWEFEVPEDGYYNITVKARQNYNRGFVSNRSVYIDGEIPFAELDAVAFKYNSKWDSITLSDENGTPYEFYLTEGKHTIRLEVTLGDLGAILNNMQDSVGRLNYIYRKVLILTGTNPDQYRDYRIAAQYPDIIDAMELEYKRLYKLVDDIVAYSGQKASQVSAILSLADQIEKFVDDPDKISREFTRFKANISSMGTSILTLTEAPLDIDYITITGTDAKPDAVKETTLGQLGHEVKSFIASFTVDYDAVGDVYDEDEAIEVWMLTGRDQSTIMKAMIDDDFTPNTGIKVNMKLIDGSILMNAVVSGEGPDVVLSIAQGEPVNYALRGAVEDLTQFDDYKEILGYFDESAYTPYQLDGALYGLPETQNYNVMFYRTDILKELEIEPPQTWEDMIAILPIIQQNNMSVAIPSTERVLNNASNPDLTGLFGLLYQNGGTVYNEAGTATEIDSEAGIRAFETYTKFFTHYKLPKTYDFANLFRSGEMPLGLADYNTYNTLVVFAPEIRGLWDFTLVPGTLKEDGTLDRSIHTWGGGTMMLKQTDETIKANAWEFMKWWVSADTQVRFGNELESVMGASARYATANIEAFERLAWTSKQIEVLEEQRSWAKGFREIAGGYFTSRHLTNAVRKVMNENEDPRETLLDYSTTIDQEIIRKRLEFGLDVK